MHGLCFGIHFFILLFFFSFAVSPKYIIRIHDGPRAAGKKINIYFFFSIKVRKGFIKGSHNFKLVYYRPPGLHGSGKEIVLSRQKSSTKSVDLYHWALILEYIGESFFTLFASLTHAYHYLMTLIK